MAPFTDDRGEPIECFTLEIEGEAVSVAMEWDRVARAYVGTLRECGIGERTLIVNPEQAEAAPSPGLTPPERRTLELLAAAWNAFAELGDKHPADNPEFAAAIHQAQNILAYRVARRVDPDIWCAKHDQAGEGADQDAA